MNNFLDPYDLSSGTPPQQPEQSLNEEVSQVMGQLGRFWGDFRKQASLFNLDQTALEAARKDIGGVVTQAQQELTKLTTTETPRAAETESEQPAAESSDEATTPRTASPATQDASTSSTGVQNLFSRLQSALPPNIVSTVQSHIPETLKQASENIDFAQMRTTLTTEFQRVQGVTRVQAEEYVHKSEVLLREAMKEAGEVLRDAVKVIPPEEAQSSGVPANLIWDGADMWMLPFDSSDPSAKGKEKAGRQSTDTQLAVATRAEALLKRLRHDPEIIKHDPEADAGAKEFYSQWLASAMKDGVDGEEWTAKITAVLNESADGQALKANQDSLVPAEMTRETFWQRYFFRVHQIEQEEEKRKTLLQRSTESEEDFSWEDEDESTPTPAAPRAAAIPSSESQSAVSPPPSEAPTTANTSPRESSEESYDLVSDNGAAPAKVKREDKKPGESDDGGDSDWE
ncbi:hypothetical protein C8F04DRAFT_940133 [Mycena alexandri]|uniref:BSD domain-containing protein n=1 Tax=Mycena alexandri TaxID=1745969 RepID=A0AAD6THA0_9AGAR|nr:hypothetical protein C8F04DRAFT_940133 [Mycena alexandri]